MLRVRRVCSVSYIKTEGEETQWRGLLKCILCYALPLREKRCGKEGHLELFGHAYPDFYYPHIFPKLCMRRKSKPFFYKNRCKLHAFILECRILRY